MCGLESASQNGCVIDCFFLDHIRSLRCVATLVKLAVICSSNYTILEQNINCLLVQ